MKKLAGFMIAQIFTIGIYISSATPLYAATMEILWGNVNKYTSTLKNFSLLQASNIPQGLLLPQDLATQTNKTNVLKFINGDIDNSRVSHSRYTQYYQGLPVWGYQVIYHLSSANTTVTGMLVNNIDKDIPDLDGKISLEKAQQIALNQTPANSKINVQKIIYFDKNISNKALLAYYISYLAKTSNGPAIPSYIIDANTGKVLQQWDALQKSELGTGPGGNTLNNLSYRPGQYQFGMIDPNVNTLGKIDIQIHGNTCSISNSWFRVINLENQTEQQLPFSLPVSTASEREFSLTPFAYNCAAPAYTNFTDNGFAPINLGFSPINDVTYFTSQTFNMYRNQYGLASPIGSELPLRVYTHLGDYENAFACGPHCMEESNVKGPQQLVFGNGETDFAPLTSGEVVAHEFGHLVTDHFSNLIYTEQSGGINEAFSDMSGMTLNDYLRKLGYLWYWNGNDWRIGTSISKDGKPLRYMNNPPLDGHSIGNAANFVPGMNVHFSSGVFNKAFYLISIKRGWNVSKAFRIMLDANMHYWIPSTDFAYGACGVIQAAFNRGYNHQDVINAFQQVGVTCLVGNEVLIKQ